MPISFLETTIAYEPLSRRSILKITKNHDFQRKKVLCDSFVIFKMHLLESGQVIFGETALN